MTFPTVVFNGVFFVLFLGVWHWHFLHFRRLLSLVLVYEQ